MTSAALFWYVYDILLKGRAGNPARLFCYRKMSEPDTRLLKVHQSLLDEMASLHARLPDNMKDVSEAFERYARIVSLMVRSLDVMTPVSKKISN